MSAFTNGFNFGFVTGMLNRTFGGFMPFGGFGCYGGGYPAFGGGFSLFGGCHNVNMFNMVPNPSISIFNSYPATQAMNFGVPSFNLNFPMIDTRNIETNQSPAVSNMNINMPMISTKNMDFSNTSTVVDNSIKTNSNLPAKKTSSESVTKPNKKYEKGESNYSALITKYAAKYNVEEALVRAVIKQESRFDPNAVSYAGAKGLMQLMPATARGLGVSDPFNPEQNIEGGVKYLRQLLDRYKGNKELALAAYNAGPGNVKNGRIPQNGQTPKYVANVMKYYNEYRVA